jgi:hypothetical protein
MTNNQKILIGVGAIALAYYFYTKSKGGGAISQTPSASNPCKNENEVPCGNGSGKCYLINARYSEDPCKIDKPINLGGDVDKKYDACLKEFESLPLPPAQYGFNFKQYKEDYINNCMKKSSTTKPSNLQTTNYTCKDGSKYSKTIDITKAQNMRFKDPCGINGGIAKQETV